MQNGVLSFHQIKLRYIFKNVIWRHLVKLNSRQTFSHMVFLPSVVAMVSLVVASTTIDCLGDCSSEQFH